ncbi:MAG: tetratricopeptide repeat protein [Desulfovibrionaceae bacterium]|nr:tetratricopeptide repeat protein [Desulfovibrionaceae bacterium]
MDTPSILHVQVTERCNLACPGCYIPERSGPFVSAQRLDERVFGPLAAVGVRFTTITGGEPLLHPDIVDISAAARRRFDEVQVVTNGMRLTPGMFGRLRQAGVTSIKFSLDGATPEVHDALRGRPGAFARLSANIRAIAALAPDKRHGVEMGAITTVQPANVHQLPDIAALAADFGLSHLLLQPLHPFDMVYPPDGQPPKRPRHDPAYLHALQESLQAVRHDTTDRPGFLDNSAEMLDQMPPFHARPAGPAQRCGANRFIFVNSRLEVRGCLFCQPFDSLAQATPEGVFSGPGWRNFQRFRRTCTLCLMGCQYYGSTQRLADRGFALLENKRVARAAGLFRASLARGFSLEAAHGLARCEMLAGHAGRAARELERLHLLAPERLVLLADRAEALAADGQTDQALALLEKACAENPSNAILAHKRGVILRNLERHAEAAKAFAHVLVLQPGHAFAGGDMCHSLLAAGRTDEALAAGERAVALAPDSSHAAHQFGLALAAAGRLDEAATALARALSLEPDHDFAGSDLCATLRSLGRLDEALDMGERAVSLTPDSAHAWHQFGLALAAAGRLAEAATAFGRAMELSPEHLYAGGDRCDVLRRLGRLDEALETGERAVRLSPRSAHAAHQYGLALAAAKNDRDALTHFLHAAELHPDGPWVRFDLGMCRHRLGDLAAAREHLEAAARLDPGMPWFRYRLGLLLEETGDAAAGLAQMRLALERGPGEERIIKELDRMLRHHGETQP